MAKKQILNDQLREEKREGLCLFLLLSHSPDRKKKQKSLVPNLTKQHKHTHVPRLKVSSSSHTHRLFMWQSNQNAANKFWMINWERKREKDWVFSYCFLIHQTERRNKKASFQIWHTHINTRMCRDWKFLVPVTLIGFSCDSLSKMLPH